MNNYDTIQHVMGKSQFVDDLNAPEGLLYASIFYSSKAHGIIKALDISEALKHEGVKGVFTAEDIPGENQIGGIISDEELFAASKVEFIGQPVAVVIAATQLNARAASRKIKIEIEELPVITDPREAFKKGNLILQPRIFAMGNVDTAWQQCDVIVEGIVESGAQEHLYLETQGAFAYPVEGGGIKIISSTQSPTAVQRVAAKVLGIPMHKVEVNVTRLGGGFGGKEDQASGWAAIAAMAAFNLNKPVKLILPRQEDMRMTGKRHPYSSDFKIGLKSSGQILAYEVTFYQNAGASADLSPAILDRTLFHATNSYYIPNVKATGISCKTNLPPNTAFRGFGGPQGMFVIESAIFRAAEKMNIEPSVIQEINLLKDQDEFHYGQKVENAHAVRAWNTAKQKFDLQKIKKEIKRFNLSNKLYKKGCALMPICFGISFTNTLMNQASALIHVYTDGSVSVSTAAIEMGQGVNEKIRQVVSNIFSISINKVKVENTNTVRIANTSPTAASSGADLNGKAAEIAANNILIRLKNAAADELKITDINLISLQNESVFAGNKKTSLRWNELIQFAYSKRISLSSHAHYATPGIFFNKNTANGKAFAYHVYGTAIIEATLDCLRGIYTIDSVKVVHDFGKSMNETIDRGQAEGAIMQGIGWMTLEEVIYEKNGRLVTDALSTYKVPDIHYTPKLVDIHFLENSVNPMGIFNSKAIGEPPFMYGIASYFAVLNAMKEFRPDKQFPISAPITPEKVLLSLYSEINKEHNEILTT